MDQPTPPNPTPTSRPSLLRGAALLMISASFLIVALVIAGLVPNSLPDRIAGSLEETRRLDKALADLAPPGANEFSLAQLGEFRRDQFLVDRRTGRVWNVTCWTDARAKPKRADQDQAGCDGIRFWNEMYVEGRTPSDAPAATTYAAFVRSQLSATETDSAPKSPTK